MDFIKEYKNSSFVFGLEIISFIFDAFFKLIPTQCRVLFWASAILILLVVVYCDKRRKIRRPLIVLLQRMHWFGIPFNIDSVNQIANFFRQEAIDNRILFSGRKAAVSADGYSPLVVIRSEEWEQLQLRFDTMFLLEKSNCAPLEHNPFSSVIRNDPENCNEESKEYNDVHFSGIYLWLWCWKAAQLLKK